MVPIDVTFASMPGTQAAIGTAGVHSLIADRPVGKAGGKGLGFNGGQLLALALGGCFCNDLQYVADDLGVKLGRIDIQVHLELDGNPLVATSAQLTVDLETADGNNPDEVIDAARKICTVANSLAQGMEVTIRSSQS